MRKALNTAIVAAAKLPPGVSQMDLWDSRLRGFGLRIGKTDKTWQVMTRVNGRKQRLKLGTAATMGLADARDAARRVMGEIASGVNPAAERAAERSAPTFSAVSEMFLTDFERQVQRGERRASTLVGYRRQINNTLTPVLGSLKVSDIRRSDLRQLLDGVVVRTPILANRLKALLSSVFRYAEDQELIDVSPAVRLKAPAANKSRDRVLTAQELNRLFGVTEVPRHRAILLTALLTACRKSEALGMRWSEVDSESWWWTIPAARSKNKREHRVLLVPTVREALVALPKHNSGLVFGGPEQAERRQTQWFAVLCAKAGIENAVFHDLRRSASSHMNRVGIESSIVERVLNHARGGVEAVYNRYSFDAEKQRALVRWERELMRIIEGETTSNLAQLRA